MSEGKNKDNGWKGPNRRYSFDQVLSLVSIMLTSLASVIVYCLSTKPIDWNVVLLGVTLPLTVCVLFLALFRQGNEARSLADKSPDQGLKPISVSEAFDLIHRTRDEIVAGSNTAIRPPFEYQSRRSEYDRFYSDIRHVLERGGEWRDLFIKSPDQETVPANDFYDSLPLALRGGYEAKEMSDVKLFAPQILIIRYRNGDSIALVGWAFHGCDDVVVFIGDAPRVVRYHEQLFRAQYNHPDAKIIHSRQWVIKPASRIRALLARLVRWLGGMMSNA